MDSIAKLLFGSVILLSTFCAPAAAQTVEYVHTDALGSVVAITNQVGQVIERTRYEPYGAALDKKVDGVGYTGHVMDEATGFVNMQQRYYDPQIGRFLSTDPITAYSNPIVMFNRYKYASNNPYRFTDPDGRQEKEKVTGSHIRGGGAGNNVSVMQVNPSGSRSRNTSGDRNAAPKDQNNLSRYAEPGRVAGLIDSGYGESVADRVAGNAGSVADEERYIYTEKYGWIDLKHLISAAAYPGYAGAGGAINPGSVIGDVREMKQMHSESGRGVGIGSGGRSEDIVAHRIASQINMGYGNRYLRGMSRGEIGAMLIQDAGPLTYQQALERFGGQ